MKYYLIIEELFESTFWCKQYVEGIKKEANRNKIKISGDSRINFKEDGIVFLISTENNCLNKIIEKNIYNKIKIIMVGPQDSICCNFSSIMCNYTYIIKNAIKYCKDNNRNKLLLYGVNPNSQGDIIFEKAFKEIMPEGFEFGKDKFDLTKQSALLLILQNYDAILCSNMIIAKSLILQMKKISNKIPWVISLLDSPLRKYSSIDITSFQQNELEIGRQALHLALELKKTNYDINITWRTKASMHIGETTDYKDYQLTGIFKASPKEQEASCFYNDSVVTNSLKAENIVTNLNNIDFEILRYLGQNYTYKQISDALEISESNIKYRMKRLQTKSKTQSKKELIWLIQNYIPKLLIK
jgi:DNA-binding CsgD family transcriptional regulator